MESVRQFSLNAAHWPSTPQTAIKNKEPLNDYRSKPWSRTIQQNKGLVEKISERLSGRDQSAIRTLGI